LILPIRVVKARRTQHATERAGVKAAEAPAPSVPLDLLLDSRVAC
jgi:hypothetical protein